MEKEDLLKLMDRIKLYPDDSICVIFKHNTSTCGKYSANLTNIKTPVLENLAEKLTKARTKRKRCIFCRKNIANYSEVKFQIKRDVMDYLIDKSNFKTLEK